MFGMIDRAGAKRVINGFSKFARFDSIPVVRRMNGEASERTSGRGVEGAERGRANEQRRSDSGIWDEGREMAGGFNEVE